MMKHSGIAAKRISRVPGFTLIELVVVVVIIAMLATLAVISLGGTMDQYRLSLATEAIEMFDARARRDARRFHTPVLASMKRGGNQLRIEVGGRSDAQYRLPRSVNIKQVRMRRRQVAGSRVEIEFNPAGASPTYAVELQRGKMTRWLVILGISGQVVELKSEDEVNEILSL